MTSSILQNLAEDQRRAVEQRAKQLLGGLIQQDQYVGELYSISYEDGLVQIHDRHRMDVGGIPGLSFLVATRIKSDEPIDYSKN